MVDSSVISIEKNSCVGCKACADVCPRKAITFKCDTEGFWYPNVDKSICNNCGLCVNKCPSTCKVIEENDDRITYAAWNEDQDIRLESTSGGVYYAIASYVLAQNGYLVGSRYSEDFKSAYHCYEENFEGLAGLAGSKYFQSDTAGIYSKTHGLLKTGRLVLFVGSPCQVTALHQFLGREYDNLITVDYICKGVPSPLLHKKKIELYERKEKSQIVFYRDKYDKYAWTDFGELIKFANGKEKFISRWKDDINNCFVERNINIRPSCYYCKNKGANYHSDITIGDFWGVSAVTEHDNKKGVSALVINTTKGQDFIDKSKHYLYLERRTLEEVKNGNPAFSRTAERPSDREAFFEHVNGAGLDSAVKKYAHKSCRRKIIDKKKVLKAKLRKWIPIIKERKVIDWGKFIKYNYFCREVYRDNDAFLVTCKGTVINIEKGSEVNIHGNVFLNYYPCYKWAKQHTLFSVAAGASFTANNRIEIAFGNTVSVSSNATMTMGYLFTGVNTNIVCHHKMDFGNNVMLGRDVCVFDSDYHKIYDERENIINDDKSVTVGDSVWIGARSMILKGSIIDNGAIISANSMVMGNVEGNRVFINKREMRSVGQNVMWMR